jgi:hypothetical protein
LLSTALSCRKNSRAYLTLILVFFTGFLALGWNFE